MYGVNMVLLVVHQINVKICYHNVRGMVVHQYIMFRGLIMFHQQSHLIEFAMMVRLRVHRANIIECVIMNISVQMNVQRILLSVYRVVTLGRLRKWWGSVDNVTSVIKMIQLGRT